MGTISSVHLTVHVYIFYTAVMTNKHTHYAEYKYTNIAQYMNIHVHYKHIHYYKRAKLTNQDLFTFSY